MTKEEAKNIVKGITDKIESTTDIDDWAEFWGFTREDYEDFLEMSIKALEQEPCEDVVSRDAFITRYKEWMRIERGKIPNDDTLAIRVIKSLPSATPKPKTDVLDKIRAEIKALSPKPTAYEVVAGNPIKEAVWETIADVLQIIDKYKAESEDKE